MSSIQERFDALERGADQVPDSHYGDLDHLGEVLARDGIDLEHAIEQVRQFEVALPTWALGSGGTRFGRFPGQGEPRNVFEKMEDAALVHRLTGAAPRVSLHIPWDEPEDPAALREFAASAGVGFDAVNSNTFQDQEKQPLSYKLGSFSNADPAVRELAVEHNCHAIDVGVALGSTAITVWLADGSNFPGQIHLRRAFNRVLGCLEQVYAALPDSWRMFTEHKPYEPAFYSTVVQDWGSSLMLAQALGTKAACLVDLGHHLPGTNIEQIVARLVHAGKLGGFHFNDSKYGDDDLTAGSIDPFQLFLVFNELVDAQRDSVPAFDPAYMIDQSHNLKDPIEALLQTVDHLQRAFARALLVDREALEAHQDGGDVLMAESTLRQAYETAVGPLVAEARRRSGGAVDPIVSFRTAGIRSLLGQKRSSAAYAPPQSL